MSDELRETVARAMAERLGSVWGGAIIRHEELTSLADAAIALVRKETLEEAARVARGTPANLENCGDYLTGIDDGGADAEAAIRAMGEK